MHPRYYACGNTSCPHFGVAREVYPTRIGKGLYAWPSVVCECSPNIELRRVFPDWHQQELDLAGTEPCS